MTPEEYLILLNRVYEEKASTQELDSLREHFQDAPDSLFDGLSDKVWTSSMKEMSLESQHSVKEKIIGRPHNKSAFTLSLVIAVAVSLSAFLGLYINEKTNTPQSFQATAQRAQKSMITMPDGTKVWLNSTTRISWDSDYNEDNRLVCLDGEAYFEVAKNQDLPFIVRTSDIDVQALGTTFNVKAYADDDQILATLVEGKVLVTSQSESQTLSPAEQISYDKNEQSMTKTVASNRYHLVPWKDDEMEFRGETLEQIAKSFERMYNVDVKFLDEESKHYSYTGLIRNNSLLNVLELICTTSPVEYRIDGDILTFRHKR